MRSNASTQVEPAEASDVLNSVVSCRWFAVTDHRREAFALRHRGYVSAGLIEASPFGVYSDAYDDIATTVVAALFRRGAAIATLRVSFWKPGATGPALPCETVYPEIQDLKARAKGPVVEISRLAIDPAITNTRYRTRLYAAAIRAGIVAALAGDAKHILVATQTKWRTFYEHVMGMKVVGAAQFYPPGNVPVVLLARDVDDGLLGRISDHMFFKVDDKELAEMRTILPSMIVGGVR